MAEIIPLGIVIDLELDGEHGVSFDGLAILSSRLEAPLLNGGYDALLELGIDQSQDDDLTGQAEFIDDQTNADGVALMRTSEDGGNHFGRLRSGPVFVARLSAARIRNGEG